MKDAATGSEKPDYALVTAAYNERKHIVKTLQSVIAQTLLPTKWVIVSDGSSDGTDEVVREYAACHQFIELRRRERRQSYNYASKVHALDIGLTRVLQLPVHFVGNLDADLSFSRSYFAEVMNRFEQNPTLGIGGGAIYERHGTRYRPRRGNRVSSVAGAVQMFRRECYQSIGGFLPLRYGGEDWCTQVMARMKGWRVETFTDLEVHHHRPTGGPAGTVGRWCRQGLMDYSLGSGPFFELCRVCRRADEYPPIIGAAARYVAYAFALFCRQQRIVPAEVMQYVRQEESQKIRFLLKRLFAPFSTGDWGCE